MDQLARAYAESFRVFSPPPSLTVSQWADEYRQLSSVSSAEPGRWRTSRAPWTRGIMDAFNDPEIEGIVVKSSAQIGKTEIINNVTGYFIHQDPSPIMILQPTRDDAEDWSKDRLMRGMVDCSPCFSGLIKEAKVKGSGNTIVHKEFPGGQLTVAWSNSESRLAMRPIRILLMDEINKYDTNPGPQGDPVGRAKSRTKNFWNRRWGVFSTPTLIEVCAISSQYEASDQRRFYISCPDCGHKFVIDFFKNIKWDKDENLKHPKYGRHRPETAYCVCLECGAAIPESQKDEMVRNGEWIAEKPGGNVAGFHISELYSSLGGSSWAGIVRRFLEAGKNPSLLQIFYNETLGEAWQMQGETVESSFLYQRREVYEADVPMGAAVLTAGVDVQKDRLEIKIKGWGVGEESWDVEYLQLFGDPSGEQVWKELDEVIYRTFKHESGINLRVVCTFVDSGGHHTQQVYKYCKARWQQFIFACKGRANTPGQPLPIVGRPSELTGHKLFTVGVDTAKQLIYRRLIISKPGHGYCHFPQKPAWDEEYFAQLTAEKQVVRYKDFRPRIEWRQMRDRNEALDLEVYALAALEARKVDLVKAHAAIMARIVPQQEVKPVEPKIVTTSTTPPPVNNPKTMRGNNSFVGNWRF